MPHPRVLVICIRIVDWSISSCKYTYSGLTLCAVALLQMVLPMVIPRVHWCASHLLSSATRTARIPTPMPIHCTPTSPNATQIQYRGHSTMPTTILQTSNVCWSQDKVIGRFARHLSLRATGPMSFGAKSEGTLTYQHPCCNTPPCLKDLSQTLGPSCNFSYASCNFTLPRTFVNGSATIVTPLICSTSIPSAAMRSLIPAARSA